MASSFQPKITSTYEDILKIPLLLLLLASQLKSSEEFLNQLISFLLYLLYIQSEI